MAALLLNCLLDAEQFPCERPLTGREMLNSERAVATALVIFFEHDEWRIYERPPASYDRRGANTLVFESDGVVRRVRSFPENWRELPPEALLALSWTA